MRAYSFSLCSVAAVTAAFVVFSLAGASPAQAYCGSAPMKPSCVNSSRGFQDEAAVRRCQSSLSRYSDSVDRYVSCLSREAEKKAREIERDKAAAQQAHKDLGEAREKYSCLISGKDYCY